MRLKIIILLLSLVLWHFSLAQSDTPDFVSAQISRVTSFNRSTPQEKVYLQFDNTSYYVGDTLWFKGWLVYAPWHTATDWSRTLYVDLLSQEGELIFTKRYKLTKGQCHGEFVFQDSLPAGFYEVRAYTRWMMNFGVGHEYSRLFPVFSQPKNEGDYRQEMPVKSFRVPDYRMDNMWRWRDKPAARLAVSFFPEGGNLVQGLSSQVAFKAVNRAGENVDIEGVVRNKTGEEVASLSVVHDGMGVFSFCPDESFYTAEFVYEGKTYKESLPAVLKEGCVLNVNTRDASHLNFHIGRSAGMRSQSLGLVLMCRGKVLFSKILEPSSDEFVDFSVFSDNIPSGVSQIVLFDASGNVLAERLVFVNHNDHLRIQTSFDREVYPAFGKIGIDFTVSDAQGRPVETEFSLSIRDASNSPGYKYADNVLTNLLLSSELRGYVHQPGYYFADTTLVRRNALDLLMLVQGWSRYSWTRMTGQEPFSVRYPAEESISVDGQILSYGLKQRPLPDVDLLMWMRSGNEVYKNKCRTDSLGRFVWAYDLFGSWDLTIQVKKNGKFKNSDIRLNRSFAPGMRKLSSYERLLPELLTEKPLAVVDQVEKSTRQEIVSDTLSDFTVPKTTFWEGTHLLEEVKVKKRRPWKQEDIGLEGASVVYNMEVVMDKLKDQGKDESVDIFDFLRKQNPYYYSERPLLGEVSGYKGDKYKGRPVIYVINNTLERGEYGTLPLESIRPEQLTYITINEHDGEACKYIPENPSCSDFVVFYLYTTPDQQLRNSLKGIRRTKLEGYSQVKEFYSPIYNRSLFPGETDYRRTLYWNPNVVTDSLGHAKVTFYNNSTCRQMIINAETVTRRGEIGVLGL